MSVRADAGQEFALALLTAAIKAGGSRHVVAATACALWRAASGVQAPDDLVAEIKEEVDARLSMAAPAVAGLVAAGRGSHCLPSGNQKAMRNFGLHAEMGCGVELLPSSPTEAKRRGRGRRAPLDEPKQSLPDQKATSHKDIGTQTSGDRASGIMDV